MNAKIQKIALSMFCCILFSCKQHVSYDPTNYAFYKEKSYERVSGYKVIANPEKYDGKQITMALYLVNLKDKGGKESLLFVNRDAAKISDTTSAIAFCEENYRAITNKNEATYAIVYGTFITKVPQRSNGIDNPVAGCIKGVDVDYSIFSWTSAPELEEYEFGIYSSRKNSPDVHPKIHLPTPLQKQRRRKFEVETE